MARKGTSPLFHAEGEDSLERAIREETKREAEEIAANLPQREPARTAYVRGLVVQVLREDLDLGVFKEMLRQTNIWDELRLVGPRARMLSERR